METKIRRTLMLLKKLETGYFYCIFLRSCISSAYVFQFFSFEAWYCPQLNKIYCFFKIYAANIFTKHFPLKSIEWFSYKLLPNCAQFRSALETSRSHNSYKSNDAGLKFCFYNVSFNVLKKLVLLPKKILPIIHFWVLL